VIVERSEGQRTIDARWVFCCRLGLLLLLGCGRADVDGVYLPPGKPSDDLPTGSSGHSEETIDASIWRTTATGPS